MKIAPAPHQHIMIDIETLGVGRDAVILSIGACNVDASPTYKFYTALSLDQSDRVIEPATLQWWLGQTQKSEIQIPTDPANRLHDALLKLNEFILTVTDFPIIWCKGTDFDTAILEHAFSYYGLTPAWKANAAYNRIRDFRTLMKFYGIVPTHIVREGVAHNALDDAVFQAKQLAYIYYLFGQNLDVRE